MSMTDEIDILFQEYQLDEFFSVVPSKFSINFFSLSASSIKNFQVIVNTLSPTGGTGSIVRGVRKFVMHNQFNSDTMVPWVFLL